MIRYISCADTQITQSRKQKKKEVKVNNNKRMMAAPKKIENITINRVLIFLEAHTAAHATHTAHSSHAATGRRFFFLRNFGDYAFGRRQ